MRAILFRTVAVAAIALFPALIVAQFRDDALCRPGLVPRAPGGGPQVADLDFDPAVASPAYKAGTGPRILIDEAHLNFHTVDGRYAPFAKLLRRDGFVVEGLKDPITEGSLSNVRILVIANALAERNKGGNWSLPTPSAFTRTEITALESWVSKGGSLFLIADHMPFGGAVADLAAPFGVHLTNGYATNRTCKTDELAFRRADGSLADHAITRGRNADERITEVRTFTGQAFRVTAPADPLLTFPSESVLLLPVKAWEFSDSTPRMAADGMLQGAVLRHGRGRVAVFGEAAMFSAQVSGAARRPMGMNAADAKQNPQFLLNVVHWLTGLLD